jgi:hypothetical protein
MKRKSGKASGTRSLAAFLFAGKIRLSGITTEGCPAHISWGLGAFRGLYFFLVTSYSIARKKKRAILI